MGISAPRARARLLNPRTPARPDLKSGAVVLAWLPPRRAHRAVGIMPFCVQHGEDPGSQRHSSFYSQPGANRFTRRETFFPLPSMQNRMRARIVWLEISLILLALAFAEAGEVLRELRTDVVLDWFVTLAPLIWINVSIVVLYAFFRFFLGPDLVPTAGTVRTGAVSFLVPNFRIIRDRGKTFRSAWGIAALAYALAYALLQGIIVVDLSGSLQPVFVVIESAVGYGPGIAWAPTTTFGIQLRPYSIAAAFALSLLSGLVFALVFRVVAMGRRTGRTLPGPLLGLAVMCPACAGGPVSGLFLAYVAPIAFMGGMGSASAFSRLLGFSTILLVVTLVLLWTVISFITNALLPDVSTTAADSALPGSA